MNGKSQKKLLFLINPFISAVNSLYTIKNHTSQKLLYWWFLIFGIGFCAFSEEADSFRYVEQFMIDSKYTYSQYISEIIKYFTFESNIKDIYSLTVNFIVGRFSNNYHFTYLIYSAIFGFFYIKCLRIFLRYNVNDKWPFFILLFLFCFSNPIYNINGARFWTAAWIGVFVVLKVFIDKNYKYLGLLIVTPLIHGSFPVWIALILVALLMSRFQKIWCILFIVSSFVSAVSYISILDSFSYFFPQFMQNQIWNYMQSDMAIEKMSGVITTSLPLYAQIFNALPGYFILALSYLLLINRKRINEDHTSKRFFNTYLVFATLTNFLSGIPSMVRFQVMATPFVIILWAMNYRHLKKYNKLLYFVPLVYCYSLLYWYRHMTDVTELYLYVLPAPITVFKYLFAV